MRKERFTRIRGLVIVGCAAVLAVAGVMTAAAATPDTSAGRAGRAGTTGRRQSRLRRPHRLKQSRRPKRPPRPPRRRPAVAEQTGDRFLLRQLLRRRLVDDGVSTTRWASAAGADPQWIYLDLGATAHVSRVRLQWDTSCATAYEIDVSADHTTWTKIYSTTAGKGGVEDLTTLDGNGRYVRMYGTKRCRSDSSHGYSLQELGVYGTDRQRHHAAEPAGTPMLVSDTPNSVTIGWTRLDRQRRRQRLRHLPRRPAVRAGERQHPDSHLQLAKPERRLRVLRERP